MSLLIDMQSATWGFAEIGIGRRVWSIGRLDRSDAQLIDPDARLAWARERKGRHSCAELAIGSVAFWLTWGEPPALKQPGVATRCEAGQSAA